MNSFLRHANEKDLWRYLRESAYNFVKQHIAKCGGAFKAVEEVDVWDMEESLAIFDDLNRTLPFLVALNDVAQVRVNEPWRVERHNLNGSN